MSIVSFAHVDQRRRSVALVGDTVVSSIGAPSFGVPSLTFDVVDQPTGSDIFEAGNALDYSELGALTFTHTGVHVITATTGNGETVSLVILVFPIQVLEVDELLYLDRPVRAMVCTAPGVRPPLTNTPRERQVNRRINILRSLAQEASLEAAAAVLENGPSAPYWGCFPSDLGLQGSLANYGACYA